MAIDRNPNTESDKPKPGSTTDAAVTDSADSSEPESIESFIKKMSDAATPVVSTPEIKVAYNGTDLTGIVPVVDVNLLETQPGVLGDHKTGPLDALPAPLPKVEFVQTHLSPDAIALNADLIYRALTRKSPQLRSTVPNPDVEAVKNILQNMEEVDRHQLEQVFEQKYGTSLRKALTTFVRPGEGRVTVEAILNSKNGETNLAGNAQIALTVTETDPVRGMRLLRAVLGTLNPVQAAALQDKFKADYGISFADAINANKGLNQAQKEVLTGLLGGITELQPNVLMDLARKATIAKDLGLLSTVLGGDLPNSIAARGLANNDTAFKQSLFDNFKLIEGSLLGPMRFVENPIANDILREGRISLATILTSDTSTILHFLDNPENTDWVFTHATPKDRRDYILGRTLAETGRRPANDAEAEAKRIYDTLEAAIQSRAEGPRQAILREQLLFGGKYLSSDLANMVSGKYLVFFGGDYNVSDMLIHIEKNLTEQQFDMLRNPNYKAEFARSLQSFLKPEEQARVLALIDAKLTAQNYNDSKAVLRPLETFIQDYKASGTVNIRQFIERLETMPQAEAAKYRTDPVFKKTVDDFAQNLIDTGDPKAENAIPLIRSYLNQIAKTGNTPVPNELDKLVREWGFVNDDRWQGMDESSIQAKKIQTIAQVELILKDPIFMSQLKSIFDRKVGKVQGPPLTREEDALLRSMNAILMQSGAGINAFYGLMAEGYDTVGWGGRRPFDGITVSDKALTYSVIAKLPADQLDNWRNSYLFDYQKAILENVLAQNGTLTVADKLRVLVTQGGKLTDMSEDFANLNAAQFTEIETEYFNKYKTDLKTDLRNTLIQREQMTPEQTALFETILSQNGKVFPIDRMRMLVNGNGGKFKEYQRFFSDLKPEDWVKLQADYKQKYGVDLKDAILDSVTRNESLDSNHQILIRHILDGNGTPQLVDRMRSFILGDGGKFSDFKRLLKDLTLEQRQQLHDEYLRAFGTNLNNDFISKVDKAYKVEYMLLLSVTPRDGLNDFFQRMSHYAHIETADGAGQAFERLTQVDEQLLRQFNATFKDVPQVVLDAMAEYYSASFERALESNEKYAEFMTNVIMTGASIAAFIAFLPGGLGVVLARAITQEMARKLVVMATLSSSGAISRPALLASFQGGNFDSSPQALLMNGGLGALEMLLSYPFGMGVLATKSTVTLTAAQATERANSVMTKIAALSGNPNDPLLASTRDEATQLIAALANSSDKEQAGTIRDQIIAALVNKNDPIAKEVAESAVILTNLTNEQFTGRASDAITKVNELATSDPGALATARSEAWNTISTNSGASPELVTKARTDLLNALVAKQDPVAIAASKALSSIESLSKVSGNELAERLRERVFQVMASTDAAAKETVVQVQRQADQALTNLLIQKIDTQAATLAGAELQSLKAQALSALNSLAGLGNTPEIATLRNQLLQALAKAKDSAAQTALEISSLMEREANKSLDFASLASFNKKMQQDPALLDAALSLLQKPKSDLDGLYTRLITEANTLPANLSEQEIASRVLNATEQLKALTDPSPEVVQSLRKQGLDAIEALAAKESDKTQLELDFYRALSRHDSTALANLASIEVVAAHDATVKQIENLIINVQAASGNPVELAALRGKALDSLAKLGETQEALALRSRILTALDQSDDPLTKIAMQAFASVKGLSSEETLSKKIMLALASGDENKLHLIKLSALRERLSIATEGIESLRQQALEVVKKLSDETRDFERLELLRQLKDKDPVSKAALEALESLEGLGTETRNRLSQGILTALEQSDIDVIKSAQISSLTEKILASSGNESALLSQALSVISTLSKDSGSARLDFLKAIENKVDAAKSAREALERSIGSQNESDLTTKIVSALSTNNAPELARIQVNLIIANIERGVGKFDAAREELLEAILKLPAKEQQEKRLLGLEALREQGDPIAKTALDLNEAFTKASEGALDLVTLAKLRQSLPQNIDAALSAFERDRSHFNSLLTSTAQSSLQRLSNLDARALTEHLAIITEQIAASKADKEVVALLQTELTSSLKTLATKIQDLNIGSFDLAAIRQRAFSSLEQLKDVATQEDIQLIRSSILNALAAKDDSLARVALNVQTYFDNASTLTARQIDELEKLDPTLRNEALALLGRTREELDQVRVGAHTRIRTVDGNKTVEELMEQISSAADELSRLASPSQAIRDSIEEQVTALTDSIARNIKAGSSGLPVDKRKEAFQILDSLSNKGFSEVEETTLRTRILDALAEKEDPTARAALAAFDSIKGLEDEAARSTNILSALNNDSFIDLRNIQIKAFQDRILSGTGDTNMLRNQALEAISHLPLESRLEAKLNLLVAIAEKDPIAKATLTIKSYFDNAINLSYEDVLAIQALNPNIRTETLAILQRNKSDLDQLVNDSLTRLGAGKPNLSLQESLDLINDSVAKLKHYEELSGPVYESARRQIASTIENIAREIEDGSINLIAGGAKRKEVFQLLDSLSQKGFSETQETELRNKILLALAAKKDPAAEAAIAAFQAIKGLEDEAARATNILSALIKDSYSDLRQIQIASIQDRISIAGSAEVHELRTQALEAISHLPIDLQQAEKFRFLVAIAEKDPTAAAAVSLKTYFDNVANLSYDDILAIEKLDHSLRSQALTLISRSKAELEQIVSDSLVRLSTLKPNLTFEETLNSLTKSMSDLKRLGDASEQISDALKQQIQASIDKIAADIRHGTATMSSDRRKEFFQLLTSLSNNGLTDAQEIELRNKIIQALTDSKDSTAIAYTAALDSLAGLSNQQTAERTSQILSALTKDSQIELRQIQISVLEEKILQSSGDTNLLRKQILDAIASLPEGMQKTEKFRILNSISQKDPIAHTALSIQDFIERSGNLSLSDLSAIEKLDPLYRSEAISLLGSTKQEFDQIISNSITRLSSVRSDLGLENYLTGISATLNELKTASELSPTLRQALQKRIEASIDAITANVRAGTTSLLSEDKKNLFTLLNQLSEQGLSDARVNRLRNSLLSALVERDDTTAKVAIAAIEAVKGLDNESALTINIFSALSKDSQIELTQIQLSSLERKILSGATDQNKLRTEAIKTIRLLPGNEPQTELARFLASIADADPVAKAARNFKNYFDNAAQLSVNDLAAIEKLDPILSNEALTVLGRSKEELEQVISSSRIRLSTIQPNASLDDAINAIDTAISDLGKLSDSSELLKGTLRQKITSAIDAIENSIRSQADAILPEKRIEAFALLNKLSQQGFNDSQVAAFRLRILEVLKQKEDPVAKAAIGALEAMRQLPDETSNYSKIVLALGKDSSDELRRLEISFIQQKILAKTGDTNLLREQAIKAISEFSENLRQDELAILLSAIQEVDPIAKATLSMKAFFDNASGLSIDDIIAIEKFDHTLRRESLSLLGRTNQQLQQIRLDAISRLQTINPETTITDAIDIIKQTREQITNFVDASPQIKDALRTKISQSIESIAADIKSGTNTLTGEKRKELFELLSNFSEAGFGDAELASLRNKILESLASTKDTTATAALASFRALEGLNEQQTIKHTSEILTALIKDSQSDLAHVQISIIQDRIFAGLGDINQLRKEAFDIIAQLPRELRQEEKLNFLAAIKDKDPVAAMAVKINSFLENEATRNLEIVAEIEKLSPEARQELLIVLGRTDKELDQAVSDTLSRLSQRQPEVVVDDTIVANTPTLSLGDLDDIATASLPLQNVTRKRVAASVESLVTEIKSGTGLLTEQRTKALELIDNLSRHEFLNDQSNLLKMKILTALAEKEDPLSTLAIVALNSAKGLQDETARSISIFSALVRNRANELRIIEVSSIEARILSGAPDVAALRTQAIKTISELPSQLQLNERIKFLTAISDKDTFAKTAIAINNILTKKIDPSFDLLALARTRSELKGTNINEILNLIERPKAELDALTTKLATAYSESLKGLDATTLSNRLASLTDQLAASVQDKEMVTVLRKQITESIDTLTKKIAELPNSFTEITALKTQVENSLRTLKPNISRLEYTRLENVIRQSITRFEKTLATHTSQVASSAAIEKMNAALAQIKALNGKDFVSVREQGLIALKQMEDVVDKQTLAQARKDFLDALAAKGDRFAINVLKRDTLLEKVYNGDFTVLKTLEREIHSSLNSKVTNQAALDFLRSEEQLIATLQTKVIRMRAADLALERLTASSDQALISAARKEATEALEAMKPHLNESAMRALQTKLDQTLSRFEKPVIATITTGAEIKVAEVNASEITASNVSQRITEMTSTIKSFKGNARELATMRTDAIKALEEAQFYVDAATLNRMRREIYEALAAQNDEFATKALKRIALREEAEKGKLNPLARLEDDLSKEITRVESLVMRLEKRKGAELELAAERRVLLALQKEQAEAAALRKTIEAKVIPVAIAATVARATARELYASNPEEPIKEVPLNLVPSATLMDLARVRLGEGPWQSAERILASDGKPHTVAEVRALTRAIQATYLLDNGSSDMSGLPVNYYFVTPDNFGALINAVKDDNIKYILLGLAN